MQVEASRTTASTVRCRGVLLLALGTLPAVVLVCVAGGTPLLTAAAVLRPVDTYGGR